MIPIERYMEDVEKNITNSISAAKTEWPQRGCICGEIKVRLFTLAAWRQLKGVQLLGGEGMQIGDFGEIEEKWKRKERAEMVLIKAFWWRLVFFEEKCDNV